MPSLLNMCCNVCVQEKGALLTCKQEGAQLLEGVALPGGMESVGGQTQHYGRSQAECLQHHRRLIHSARRSNSHRQARRLFTPPPTSLSGCDTAVCQ